jgi:hypothetical protein
VFLLMFVCVDLKNGDLLLMIKRQVCQRVLQHGAKFFWDVDGWMDVFSFKKICVCVEWIVLCDK